MNAKAQFGKRAGTGAFLPFLDPVGKVNKGSTLPVRKTVGERPEIAQSFRRAYGSLLGLSARSPIIGNIRKGSIPEYKLRQPGLIEASTPGAA